MFFTTYFYNRKNCKQPKNQASVAEKINWYAPTVEHCAAINKCLRDIPGGPAVETLHFQCKGCGFEPWSGN